MTKRQISLVLSAAAMIVAMAFVVPMVSTRFEPLIAYVSILAVYWTGFCLPVAVIFGREGRSISLTPKGVPLWAPVLALGLPVLVAFGAGLFTLETPQASLIAIAVSVALINGPLEELAWRRTFRANSGDRLSFELLGLLLFAAWHLPLLLTRGVDFDHGALGLVGGAALMGGVWVLMTRATNSVGWPMISHTLVNMAAFVPHFQQNFAT